MPKSAKQYFEEMCREAGYSAEQTTALVALVSDPKVSGKFDEVVANGTDNYQAQLGRVKAAEDKLKEYGTWYGTASAQYTEMQTKLADAQTKLAALAGVTPNNGSGNGSGSGSGSGDGEPKFLTAADLAAYDKERAERFAKTIKETTRLASRHAAKWGEELDVEAIDKIATEQNLPLTAAYDKWIEPRVKEKEKLAQEEFKKTTREEIERDLRSRFQLPVDTTPPAPSPMFAGKPASQMSESELDAKLVATFNSAAKK